MAQQLPFYSDLDLNLTPHPVTGDIVVRTGAEAISQSFKNLVYTNHGERPFHYDLGANLIAQLFENFSPITSKIIELNIRRVATYDEPRARLQKLVIADRKDQNGLSVRVTYQPRYFTSPVAIDLFFSRVR